MGYIERKAMAELLKDKWVLVGTGSRSYIKLPGKTQLAFQARLVDTMKRAQIVHPNLVVMSGMCEGWDEQMAQAANEAGIPWVGVVPHLTYGSWYWGGHSELNVNRLGEFDALLDSSLAWCTAADGIYVTKDGRSYHSNFFRNDVMVKLGDAFWVFNPTSKGTSHCVRGIRAAGKPMWEVTPAGFHKMA